MREKKTVFHAGDAILKGKTHLCVSSAQVRVELSTSKKITTMAKKKKTAKKKTAAKRKKRV
jgi:hypothetical protein